ncbi:MAG: tetratricopeptide repeat protein [Hyphomicrobiales bacterium]
MRNIMTLGFAAMLVVSMSGFALAAGGGGGGTKVSPSAKDCKKGEVWNKKKKKCLKAESGVLPDADLYEQGRALAKEGNYDWALDVLAAIKNQNDPHVLNYIGYSNRKAGRLEIGITFYRKALAIDPDFVLAREYLGEGYVATGRIDLAKAELAEIARRCGTTCEEYKDLSEAIATASN